MSIHRCAFRVAWAVGVGLMMLVPIQAGQAPKTTSQDPEVLPGRHTTWTLAAVGDAITTAAWLRSTTTRIRVFSSSFARSKAQRRVAEPGNFSLQTSGLSWLARGREWRQLGARAARGGERPDAHGVHPLQPRKQSHDRLGSRRHERHRPPARFARTGARGQRVQPRSGEQARLRGHGQGARRVHRHGHHIPADGASWRSARTDHGAARHQRGPYRPAVPARSGGVPGASRRSWVRPFPRIPHFRSGCLARSSSRVQKPASSKRSTETTRSGCCARFAMRPTRPTT